MRLGLRAYLSVLLVGSCCQTWAFAANLGQTVSPGGEKPLILIQANLKYLAAQAARGLQMVLTPVFRGSELVAENVVLTRDDFLQDAAIRTDHHPCMSFVEVPVTPLSPAPSADGSTRSGGYLTLHALRERDVLMQSSPRMAVDIVLERGMFLASSPHNLRLWVSSVPPSACDGGVPRGAQVLAEAYAECDTSVVTLAVSLPSSVFTCAPGSAKAAGHAPSGVEPHSSKRHPRSLLTVFYLTVQVDASDQASSTPLRHFHVAQERQVMMRALPGVRGRLQVATQKPPQAWSNP